MMNIINKAYAIIPLVEDMINTIDSLREKYTKNLIIICTIHAIMFFMTIIFSLCSRHYEAILSVIADILMVFLSVSRYREFSDELEKSYMTARSALYGDDYKDVYLNEEKIMVTYGDLREMLRYIKECIRTDIIINMNIIGFQLAYIILAILY